MQFFRDEALLRRAGGLAIILGLLGWGARAWRDGMETSGRFDSDAHAVADLLVHALWGLAIACLLYLAVSLLLTPRAGAGAVRERDGEPGWRWFVDQGGR